MILMMFFAVKGSLSLTGTEPLSGQSSSVQFQVNRGPGAFGKVAVDYKVLSIDYEFTNAMIIDWCVLFLII